MNSHPAPLWQPQAEHTVRDLRVLVAIGAPRLPIGHLDVHPKKRGALVPCLPGASEKGLKCAPSAHGVWVFDHSGTGEELKSGQQAGAWLHAQLPDVTVTWVVPSAGYMGDDAGAPRDAAYVMTLSPLAETDGEIRFQDGAVVRSHQRLLTVERAGRVHLAEPYSVHGNRRA